MRTERVQAARVRDWNRYESRYIGPEGPDPITPYRRGVCRDRHPLGCGVPRCWACHADKLAEIPDPKDVRQLQAAQAEQ